MMYNAAFVRADHTYIYSAIVSWGQAYGIVDPAYTRPDLIRTPKIADPRPW